MASTQNTQFDVYINTEILNLMKTKKSSNKVISKRIYVILDNLVLSRVFVENSNQKHDK